MLLSVLLYGALFLLGIYYVQYIRTPPGYPPGPSRIPILGNLISLLTSGGCYVKRLRSWSRKYGPIFSIRMGFWNMVVISDYDLAKEALSKNEWADRPQYPFLHYMMKYKDTGVVFANGKDWRERRRFCLKNLRDFGLGRSSMETLILDELKTLGNILCPMERGEQVNPNQEVELGEALNAAVTNVIWWMMANKRVTKDDPDFLQILHTIESQIEFDISNLLSFFPVIFRNVPQSWANIPKLQKRRDHLYRYMQSIVDKHESTLDPNEPRDLIDSLLIERRRLQDAGDPDQELYDDDNIGWTLADLFAAGAETTSTTLRWFILYMIEYPDVQQKIQEEIDSVVGKDRLPSWEDRSRMPYTEACILELWRHVTIVPMGVDHLSNQDVSLAGYRIPKGTGLVTLIYAIHHDPENFEDPESFKPERFLTQNGELEKNPKIMPFQIGKRQCLGESLARMNTFLGVAYLLQQFEFSKIPGKSYDLRPKPWAEIIHSPKPYKLHVHPRK